MIKSTIYFFLISLLSVSLLTSCGGGGDEGESSKPSPSERLKKKRAEKKDVDPMDNIGIGPIKSLTLPAEIDEAMSATGKKIYKEKCTACHKISKKFIGPSPKGIMDRRNPAWVMNMILNPEEMILKDPIAKKLLLEANGSPMANQNLKEDEARAIVEYFRTL